MDKDTWVIARERGGAALSPPWRDICAELRPVPAPGPSLVSAHGSNEGVS